MYVCGGQKRVWADFRVSGAWRLAYGCLGWDSPQKIRFLIMSKTVLYCTVLLDHHFTHRQGFDLDLDLDFDLDLDLDLGRSATPLRVEPATATTTTPSSSCRYLDRQIDIYIDRQIDRQLFLYEHCKVNYPLSCIWEGLRGPTTKGVLYYTHPHTIISCWINP